MTPAASSAAAVQQYCNDGNTWLLTWFPCWPATAACPACVPQQRNAKFKHYGKENFVLNVPEFSANPGELVAVAGRVGAGKSSLIQAILGNMQPVAGSAETGGRISYVPQNPWCQNLTLRDNILFGLPYDDDKYARVGTLPARRLGVSWWSSAAVNSSRHPGHE